MSLISEIENNLVLIGALYLLVKEKFFSKNLDASSSRVIDADVARPLLEQLLIHNERITNTILRFSGLLGKAVKLSKIQMRLEHSAFLLRKVLDLANEE